MSKKSTMELKSPETIILEVENYRPSYCISHNSFYQSDCYNEKADDEYIMDIDCKIIQLPDRLRKKHLGETCELSLLSAIQFIKKSGIYSESQPLFFGTLRLWGQQRSGLAYLPSNRLWIIEQQIRLSIFKFIEIRTDYLTRGQGEIESLCLTQ